jgi:probable phosphoglycerate mutase
MASTVLLARHGESTWNRAGRVQGWAPVSLTDRGQSQAAALARHVADEYRVDLLYASDLVRAQETTRPVGRELGLEPTFESAWRERDFGAMQGLTDEELFEGFPQYALHKVGTAAVDERPPSGETLRKTRMRVLSKWMSLRDSLSEGETVLVVGHGGPIYLVLGAVKGLDVVSAIVDQTQDNGALSELRVEGETARVVRENVTEYLP